MPRFVSTLAAIATCAMLSCFGTDLTAADDGPSTSASTKIPSVNDKAPDFTLNTLDGGQVTLSKLTAQAPVILVVLRGYPGYQCPICATQVGGLVAQAKDLAAANAQVVLVYPGPGENLATRATEFLDWRNLKGTKLPESFTYVTDPDYRFTLSYGLRWKRAPRDSISVDFRR